MGKFAYDMENLNEFEAAYPDEIGAINQVTSVIGFRNLPLHELVREFLEAV
jgi:hypothetical protein